MIPHDRIQAKAIEKTKAREVDYKTSQLAEAWQTMTIHSLAQAVSYKVERAIQPATSPVKRLDDLEDAYNFIAALYERFLGAESK